MILFFHFICLIARYIALNISKTFAKPKVPSEEQLSEATSSISSSENRPKGRLEYSKYPVYESGTLKFFPPVYVQRYETVAFVLQDSDLEGEIRKVVDFGCAELGFFSYLKSIEGVSEILEVDINAEVLERYSFKAAPITSDYLMGKRDIPLNVYIMAGNVAEYDDCLLNCDAVVGIELIEHLIEEDLEKMPYNIFYKVKPKIAIFTTPNADFNSLLPNFNEKRHEDHKFEWTRKEFFKWTQQILSEYPEYSVRFFGIGAGPEGTENLGCCTQMAVFRRLDDVESYVTSRDKFEGINNYRLIKHYEFPAFVDNRTTEEKIVHEIQYHAAYLKGLDSYYNFETNKSEIPFSLLKEYVSEFQYSDEDLRRVLSSRGLTLIEKNNSWFVVFSDTESISSDCNVSCENWLNEDTPVNESCDLSFEERWSDEEPVSFEKLLQSQMGMKSKSKKKFSFNEPDLTLFSEEDHECVPDSNQRNSPVPDNCNCLLNAEKPLQKSPDYDVENPQIRRSSLFKSKIAHKMGDRETELMQMRRKSIFHVCTCKKIPKSRSLDSLLDNMKLGSSEQDSHLNSILESFNPGSPLSSCKSRHGINHSESSLLSPSFDKGADGGYLFSYLPTSGVSTPEELELTRSSSPFSESELHHSVFFNNQ